MCFDVIHIKSTTLLTECAKIWSSDVAIIILLIMGHDILNLLMMSEISSSRKISHNFV